MGMAASQARYLGLTARKTNVEYEGQQINQARTALANQSANTFNELLALEVPTAPSSQDYTTLQYSYTDGTTEETITDMSELVNDPDGYNYMISHYHYSDIYSGVVSRKQNPQVSFGTKASKDIVSNDKVTYDGTNYTVDGKALTKYDSTVEEQKAAYSQIVKDYPDFVKFDVDSVYTYTSDDGKLNFVSTTDLSKAAIVSSDLASYTVKDNVPAYVGNNKVLPYDQLDSEQVTAYEQICKDFPSEDIAHTAAENIYTWTSGGKTYFATLDELTKTANSAPDTTKPTENQSRLTAYDAETVKTKVEQKQKAFVQLDDSGRPQNIRYEDSSITYALNTETKTDENAYNDAMNQYNYDMQVYEKKIADINAKTEKIQEQDRTLELRLRQLDTEQEALQTEMESVKKVIDKNIESTYKTFE